jgi:hypothetical protein
MGWKQDYDAMNASLKKRDMKNYYVNLFKLATPLFMWILIITFYGVGFLASYDLIVGIVKLEALQRWQYAGILFMIVYNLKLIFSSGSATSAKQMI